jgi:hypothetical protein
MAYVTQEMWDAAQAALAAALPVLKAHTPRLSTSGSMVSLVKQVEGALWNRRPAQPQSVSVPRGAVPVYFDVIGNCYCKMPLNCNEAPEFYVVSALTASQRQECEACWGAGEIQQCDGPTGHMEPCESCNGTGQRQEQT